MNQVFNNKKLELLLFGLFALINISLYLFSVDGATFLEGADASQYYKPAIGLVNYGELRIGNEEIYLTYGTPLYSFFLAVPIGLFGFDSSLPVIVTLQCLMLYITGIVARKFSKFFFHKESYIVHALIIFNPNSFITAHLIQSETLFTLLLTILIFYCFKLFSEYKVKNLAILGLMAGLLTLTRPGGYYLIFLLPFFVFLQAFTQKKEIYNRVNIKFIKKHFLSIVLPLIVALIVISPWSVRNLMLYDQFFLSSNAGAYIKAQFIQLLKISRGYSESEAINTSDQLHLTYLMHNNKDVTCVDNDRSWQCSDDAFKAVLPGLLKEPIDSHIKALTHSLAYLYFSGGASNFRNYLGISGKSSILSFQREEYKGLESFKIFLESINSAYIAILIFTTTFSVLSRFLVIIGLYALVRKGDIFNPNVIILLSILAVFTMMYIYLGQSRFRVPLEPILTIFSVIGLNFFKWKILNREKFKN